MKTPNQLPEVTHQTPEMKSECECTKATWNLIGHLRLNKSDYDHHPQPPPLPLEVKSANTHPSASFSGFIQMGMDLMALFQTAT